MDQRSHHDAAKNDLADAERLMNRGSLRLAGEAYWGAIVHAVSAADPDHTIQPRDRFGNAHNTPNAEREYHAPTYRIRNAGNPVLHPNQPTAADHNNALLIGQKQLHNNFYHLNLTPIQLAAYVSIARQLAEDLTAYAEALLPPTQPTGDSPNLASPNTRNP